MLARGKPGMTEEQVKDFVSRCYPACLSLSLQHDGFCAAMVAELHTDLLMAASGSPETQLPVKSAMVVGNMSQSAPKHGCSEGVSRTATALQVHGSV